MNNEATSRHVALMLVTKMLDGTAPHRIKLRTRIQPYIMSKLRDMVQRTANLHSEARAFEEVGSPSVPRATMSGSNRVVLKASFHSDRSRQSLARSDSFTRK
jgi:hypothetical protein